MDTEELVIQVRNSTQVGPFLPFTALPKEFAGKKVRLTIVRGDEQCLPWEGEMDPDLLATRERIKDGYKPLL